MEYKEVIKEIVVLAFDKAKKESLQTFKTPLSKHISSRIENKFKIYISEKTFVRYYDKFIGGKDKATGVPNRRIVDSICKYIGFENFVDFYHKNKKFKKRMDKKSGIGLSDYSNSTCEEMLFIQKKKRRMNSLFFSVLILNRICKYVKEKEFLYFCKGILDHIFSKEILPSFIYSDNIYLQER